MWQVDVSEVVVGADPNAVYMVMEFMDHELKALMDTMPRPFSTAEVLVDLLDQSQQPHCSLSDPNKVSMAMPAVVMLSPLFACLVM